MAIVWNAQRETLRLINPTRVTRGLRRAARLGVVPSPQFGRPESALVMLRRAVA